MAPEPPGAPPRPAARPAPPARGAVAARALSIVGHPAVVMPLAVSLAAAKRDAPGPVLLLAAAMAVAIAAVVGAYSWWQVRSGRWSHVDASDPRERQDLNLFVAPLLPALAAAMGLSGQSHALVVGLALQRRLKASLHCAFGAFAATVVGPGIAAALLGALALGVGWSRLRLGRHDALEVPVGLGLGGAAGAAFHWAAGTGGAT